MESNRAPSGESGGGVFVRSPLSIKIRQSRFLKNTATFGGAFDIINVQILEITDSLFVSNYALGQGGFGGALSVRFLPPPESLL